ncbi:MAG: arsenic resistance N-acetyltransferase ArsN2 [Ignavibacteria bacterium]
MHIAPEPAAQEVTALLAECGLPTADISPRTSLRFFGVRDGGRLAAVVGVELHPPVALLRSLAVLPSWRGRGCGRALVGFAESFAASQGVETLFLLTATAEEFFRSLGYAPALRDAAPAAIRATPQFASLCPATSSFLSKHVGAAKQTLQPGESQMPIQSSACSSSGSGNPCDVLLQFLWRPPVTEAGLAQLLGKGCCDVNAPNSAGMSPLKAAVMNCGFTIVQMLIEAGARVSADLVEFAQRSYPSKTEIIGALKSACLKAELERELSAKGSTKKFKV